VPRDLTGLRDRRGQATTLHLDRQAGVAARGWSRVMMRSMDDNITLRLLPKTTPTGGDDRSRRRALYVVRLRNDNVSIHPRPTHSDTYNVSLLPPPAAVDGLRDRSPCSFSRSRTCVLAA